MISIKATLAEANPKGAKLTIFPKAGHEGSQWYSSVSTTRGFSEKSMETWRIRKHFPHGHHRNRF